MTPGSGMRAICSAVDLSAAACSADAAGMTKSACTVASCLNPWVNPVRRLCPYGSSVDTTMAESKPSTPLA